MRAFAVPLVAVLVIVSVAGVTAYRDLGQGGEEEVYGFPSDLEAQKEAPVVRRNGAPGPAPTFKQARSGEAEPTVQAEIVEPEGAAEGAPPEWLRTVFDLLAGLGVFGEPEAPAPPPGPMETVERTGFDTAEGRVAPGHDFSTPDASAPGYRAQTPVYPGASDGGTVRARTATPAPRGISE